MANYVKFRKGSPQAYANLAPNYDDDTLYFIVDQDDNDGQLYLGSKLISSGEINNFSIGDLNDIIIDTVGDKQILVYDTALSSWVNADYKDIIKDFIGATTTSTGVSGLVPAPEEGKVNLFLRSDGKWAEIEIPDIVPSMSISGESPISVDENGVISLTIDNTTLGIIDNSLSIKGFEDAEVNSILTKTENGLEWIIPEANRNEEFAAAIEKLDGDVSTLKQQVGQAAITDEEGNETTPASGLFADVKNLEKDINDVNSNIETIQTSISEIEERVEKTETDIFEMDKDITQLKSDIQTVNSNISSLEQTKANVDDVYTKEETVSQIEAAIAAVDHLKRKVVASTEAIDVDAIDAEQYIYMIPNKDGTYDEYMIIEGELEKVGDWKTDLSGYATTEQLTQATNALTTKIDQKADIVYYPVKDEETGAVTQVPGTFLSPEDEEKLNALVIDKDGNIGISGSVNAENVEGLGTWITENSAIYITGLTENNLGKSVLDKLNFITSVNTSDFTVTDGKLELNNLDMSKVNGLIDALDTKVSLEQFNTLNTTVQNLVANVESLDDIFVTKTVFDSNVGDLNTLISTNTTNIGILSEKLEVLDEHLTWGDI